MKRIIKTRPDAPEGSIEFGPIGNERSVYERDDSGEIENIYDLLSNVCCDGDFGNEDCNNEDPLKQHCKDGWARGLEIRDEFNEWCVIDGKEVIARNGLKEGRNGLITDADYYMSLTIRIDLYSCAQWDVFSGMDEWGLNNVGKFFSISNKHPEKRMLPGYFSNKAMSICHQPPTEKDPAVLFSHMRYFSDEFSWLLVFTKEVETDIHPLHKKQKSKKTVVVQDEIDGMYGIDTLIWHKHDCDWDLTGEQK